MVDRLISAPGTLEAAGAFCRILWNETQKSLWVFSVDISQEGAPKKEENKGMLNPIFNVSVIHVTEAWRDKG